MSTSFQIVLNLLETICQPNPSVVQDPIKRDNIFRKNRSILILTTFVLVSTIFNASTAPSANRSTYYSQIFCISLNIFAICLLCRSYFHVLQVYFFFMVAINGPVRNLFTTEAVLLSWVNVYLMPLNMLFLIGVRSFIFHTVIQLACLHILYKQQMVKCIEEMGPSLFIDRLACCTTASLIICSTMLLNTYYTAMKAKQSVFLDKMKKEELKNQKYLLLGFSHELRNLINALMGNVKLARYEHLDEKLSKFIGAAEIYGELLTHLVNNILDSGKAEIGELEINTSRSTMACLLSKMWGVCSELIKNKNLTGTLRVHNKLPHAVKVDNHRLQQIVMNLVGNSIKFTETGAVNVIIEWIEDCEEVTTKCFEPLPFDTINEGLFEKSQAMSSLDSAIMSYSLNDKRIKLPDDGRQEQANKGVLKIIVTDTGCGIHDNRLQKIFKKFAQVEDDPDTRKLGTGLGLFITKELVLRMNGEIRAFSKSGVGTVFIACIPVESIIEEKKEVTLERPAFLEMMKLLAPKVLVVDDVKFNSVLIGNLLGKLNLNVHHMAINGLEAVEKYKAQTKGGKSYDIVTMDVEMPVMDGKTAMHLIREYEKENSLEPCLMIMVSGNCSESEIAECIEVNDRQKPEKADYFLKKPTSVEDFYEVIKEKYDN